MSSSHHLESQKKKLDNWKLFIHLFIQSLIFWNLVSEFQNKKQETKARVQDGLPEKAINFNSGDWDYRRLKSLHSSNTVRIVKLFALGKYNTQNGPVSNNPSLSCRCSLFFTLTTTTKTPNKTEIPSFQNIPTIQF